MSQDEQYSISADQECVGCRDRKAKISVLQSRLAQAEKENSDLKEKLAKAEAREHQWFVSSNAHQQNLKYAEQERDALRRDLDEARELLKWALVVEDHSRQWVEFRKSVNAFLDRPTPQVPTKPEGGECGISDCKDWRDHGDGKHGPEDAD